jgi:hypothetical protein
MGETIRFSASSTRDQVRAGIVEIHDGHSFDSSLVNLDVPSELSSVKKCAALPGSRRERRVESLTVSLVATGTRPAAGAMRRIIRRGSVPKVQQ